MSGRKVILRVATALIVGPGMWIDRDTFKPMGINPPVIFDDNIFITIANYSANSDLDVRGSDPI
jgi:hypothetical protein